MFDSMRRMRGFYYEYKKEKKCSLSLLVKMNNGKNDKKVVWCSFQRRRRRRRRRDRKDEFLLDKKIGVPIN